MILGIGTLARSAKDSDIQVTEIIHTRNAGVAVTSVMRLAACANRIAILAEQHCGARDSEAK
jgi:hypothetical protein